MLREAWDQYWLDYAEQNKLSRSKPYYDHTEESKDESLKFFMTQSNFGPKITENMFNQNKTLTKLLIFHEKVYKEKSTVTQDDITDEIL